MDNEHPQQSAFIGAIEAAEKFFPDLPVMFIVASITKNEEGKADFPCGVGGRNLNQLSKEGGASLIAATLRSVYEACIEINGGSKSEGKAMFVNAISESFGLHLETSTKHVEEAARGYPNLGEEFIKHLKDAT